MWAAFLTLVCNVESSKAGLLASWRAFLNAFSCSAGTAWLAKCANTAQKTRFNCKISGPFLGPKISQKRSLSNRAVPVATAIGKTKHPAGSNLTVESECVFWALPLSSCILKRTGGIDGISRSVPRFATPRTSSGVVLRHQNAGPKMGPFSEPSVIVPTLEGSETSSNSGPSFGPAFHPFFECRFLTRDVASRHCCEGHNRSQSLSYLCNQHVSLCFCKIQRHNGNNVAQLCYAIDQTKQR